MANQKPLVLSSSGQLQRLQANDSIFPSALGTGTPSVDAYLRGDGTWAAIASANTASTLVLRDASGDFSAGVITADLTGNAATATNVAYSGLTGTVPTWNQDTTGNAATATTANNVAYSGLTGVIPTWNQDTTGNAATATNVAYSGLTGTIPTWNQSTTGNAATATNVAFSGLTGVVPTWNQDTTGNAATVSTNANLTGEVTSVGNTTTVTNSTVISKILTGFLSSSGVVAATDTILQAINKIVGNLGLKANTASPTFTGTVSGVTAAMVGAPSGSGTSSGTNTGDQTDISGNAATATNVAYTGLTGTVPTWNQDTTGNATTATNLTGLTSTIANLNTLTGALGSAAFTASTNYQPSLGYTPVQQGGGTSQGANKIRIGWDNTSSLRVQVDATDFGSIWPISIGGNATNLTGTPTLPNGVSATTQAVADNTTKLATTAFVQSAVQPLAPLANPYFTGQVFMPEGTSSVPGIAFVNDGAPDTGLYHIADGTFGVTCNTQPVVLFKPTGAEFQNNPIAPTQASTDNSQRLATTAFVQAAAVSKTSATGSAQLPAGTTAQRDAAPVFGSTRANSDLNQTEWWNGTTWSPMGGGATGGPGNYAFFENDQTISANYTLTAGKNAMSAGPITINTGVVVTIPTGAVWSII